MSDSSREFPVLLYGGDLPFIPRADRLPAESLDASYEKAVSRGARHGVLAAAELLLASQSVEISYVDITHTVPGYHDTTETFYTAESVVAFNDHRGGSESAYKISVQADQGTGPEPYVLYAPPTDDGVEQNRTFHRSNFVFLSAKPDQSEYGSGVPNPLKTVDNTMRTQICTDYHYYLLGSFTPNAMLTQTLETAGFSFERQPYGSDELRYINKNRALKDETVYESWPSGQFDEEISRLRAIKL